MCRVLAMFAWLAVGCGRIGFGEIERDAPGDGAMTTDATDAPGVVAIDYLKPAITDAGDRFGSVVAISGDGNTLAIGAWGESSNAVGLNGDPANNAANVSGAVYVFVRAGSGWTQQAYIKASNAEANDLFGWSVALSSDGSTLAVGAPGEDSGSTTIDVGQIDNAATDAGAAYVFTRTGTTWAQQAYIKGSNTNGGDTFGQTVTLSDDGRLLAVGAIFEDGNGTGATGDPLNNFAFGAGAVYVFTRAGVVWSQETYLKASNTGTGDTFGSAVALSGDGTRLAVAAYAEASGAIGINGNELDNTLPQAGAVYVFTHGGGTWAQEAYVKASNPDGGDFFGYAIALSRDGSRLAVTSEGEDGASIGVGGPQIEGAGQAGAAYVFVRSGSAWSQETYVKATNTTADDRFGRSIALSGDGTRLVVGAPQEDSTAVGLGGNQADETAPDAGAAYVYARTGTSWTATDYIKATNTKAGDAFGQSVAISATGGALVIGAHAQDNQAGAVYVVE